MDIISVPPDKLNEFAKVLGQKGGLATKERYGSQHFKDMRKLSSGNRKNKAKIGT